MKSEQKIESLQNHKHFNSTFLFVKKILLHLLDVDAIAILLITAEKHLTYNIVHFNAARQSAALSTLLCIDNFLFCLNDVTDCTEQQV